MASSDFSPERAGKGFLQTPPKLWNMFSDDETFRELLRRHFKENRARAGASGAWITVENDLHKFGNVIKDELNPLLPELERNKPWVRITDIHILIKGYH